MFVNTAFDGMSHEEKNSVREAFTLINRTSFFGRLKLERAKLMLQHARAANASVEGKEQLAAQALGFSEIELFIETLESLDSNRK